MTLSRRTFLAGTAVAGAAAASPLLRFSLADGGAPLRMPARKLPRPFETAFVRPPTSVPVVSTPGADYHLIDIAATKAEIVPGFLTDLWAYNGSVPGPTIRARRGRQVVARFINRLPSMHPVLGYESFTNVHLHGGASKPQYDGYASDILHPGHFKDYRWDNTERSRSLWYHDHSVHHTWTNVAMGLAGQYFITDPADDAFGLPTGEYDVPLHISDALFQADGQLYMSLDNTKGLWGDVMLVNGKPWPAMKVQRRKYRFRIVNGCVSRSLFLRLSTNDAITVISTDAGLVPRPVEVGAFRQSNGERYDIVVDFSKYRAGTRVTLVNDSLPYNDDYVNTDKVMAFDVTDAGFDPSANSVPTELVPDNDAMTIPVPPAVTVRQFRTERQGGEWTLNGHTWHDVIDSNFTLVEAAPLVGDTEIWEFRNSSGGWSHPMHVHGVDGRLLSRNGNAPYAYEVGPKDTYYVGENETLRVLMRFDLPGKYMVHCHNGVHEDHDMMVQYEAVSTTQIADDPFAATAEVYSGQQL